MTPQPSLFFYDLETSGLSARFQRIMQFAGQRTDMNLKPLGEPVNVLVRLSEDILPEPEAVLITGTTPQKTHQTGISEPELARLIDSQVCTPGTTMVGFNNIRFDDEFIRHTLWRNFYDPYEWAHKDGRSRWDIWQVALMARALRPVGIKWPIGKDELPSNRLEELSRANKLIHTDAHDAMSDVTATIELARLIKKKQPRLFEYLLKMRVKNEVSKLVNPQHPEPFVYTSGRYGKQKNFTTVAWPLVRGAYPGSVLVYDLAIDPSPFVAMDGNTLTKTMFASRQDKAKPDFQILPVKELAYNRCPAVAPIKVMDEVSWRRLNLTQKDVDQRLALLKKYPDFAKKLATSLKTKPAYQTSTDVEDQLYEDFTPDQDRPRQKIVREADAAKLGELRPQFSDKRLAELFIRYKARWFPTSLQEDETKHWQQYRQASFAKAAPAYLQKLAELSQTTVGDDQAQFLLEELRLWCESTAPLET